MTDAHYIHTSLYHFNADARKVVISRFNDTLNDASARCWYDTLEDAFEMRCPGSLGPDADAVLVTAIAKYIDEELELASRQEREPNIERFHQSRLDDYDHITAEQNRQTMTTNTAAPLLVKFHDINVEGVDGVSMLKLYRLVDLPPRLLERSLGSRFVAQEDRAVKFGLVIRAVRTFNREHFFNGRLGNALPLLGADTEAELLDLAIFQTTMLPIQQQSEDDESELFTWRFKGEQPTIAQWLEGVGSTEQFADSEEKAVMPKETRKLLIAEHTHQNPVLGRIRLAKGASVSLSDSESLSDDDGGQDTTAQSAKDAFENMLQGRSSSDDPDDDSQSSAGAAEHPKSRHTFAELLQRNRQVLPTKPALTRRTQRQSGTGTESSTVVSAAHHSAANDNHALALDALAEQRKRTISPKSSAAGQVPPAVEYGASTSKDGLPVYGQKFAAIDQVGLAADTEAQARWDLGHARDRIQTPTPDAFSTSQSGSPAHTPATRSKVMNDSMGQDSEPASTPAATLPVPRSSHTIMSYAETPPIADSWARNKVPNCTSHGVLVDSSVNDARSSIRPPPGFHPIPVTIGQRNIRDLQSCQSLTADERTIKENLLIDTRDSAPTTPTRAAWVPKKVSALLQPFQEPTAPAPDPHRTVLLNPKDEIHERLQVSTEEPHRKHYTMRQKAPKKKAKSVSKGQGLKVQSPKPEPLPLPGSLRKGKGKTDHQPCKVTISPEQEPNAADVSSCSVKALIPTPIEDVSARKSVDTKDQKTSMKELMDVAVHNQACMVKVSFGTILLQPTDDKALRRNALTAQVLRDTLHSLQEAAFLPRMSTSVSDAIHVLDLAEGAVNAKALHIFVVRDRDGAVHEIQIPSGATDQVLSTCTYELAILNIHYPFRIWDAKAVVTSSARSSGKAFSKDVLRQFANTLHTIIEVPSFAIRIPSNAFTVEKVYAKREYSRQIEVGRLVVTEVQDLFLSSLNMKHANLEAICKSREDMIAAHRYWWEVSLHVDDLLVDAERLQDAVDSLVTQMDGVGFSNVGPWYRAPESETRKTMDTAIPFW